MVSSRSPYQRVLAIAEAAETMAELHRQNIYHRDLKPANLSTTMIAAVWSISVWLTIPGKEILQQGRTAGPKWTMAPEGSEKRRKRRCVPADSIPGKSLWINIEGSSTRFDGEYNKIVIYPSHHFSLRTFRTTRRTSLCCHFKPTKSASFNGQVRGWTSTMGGAGFRLITSSNPVVWRELFC